MNDEGVSTQPQWIKPLKTLEVGNKVFKSGFDCELTKEDLEKARRELGETEETKDVCLRQLKDMLSISEDPKLKIRQDDFFLLRYLRCRKYDVEKAYKGVMSMYEIRRKHKECFTIHPEMETLQALNIVTYLPYLDEEGRIILILNLNRWKPHENTFEEVISTVLSVVELATMNPKIQINGIVGIYDLSGLTLRQMSECLKNGRLFSGLSLLQNGYPCRIKKGILVNSSRLERFLINLVKPFLSKKVAERVVLLGSDMNELHEHVNPAILPKRMQGNLDEEECDTSKLVLSNLPYLRYEWSFGHKEH